MNIIFFCEKTQFFTMVISPQLTTPGTRCHEAADLHPNDPRSPPIDLRDARPLRHADARCGSSVKAQKPRRLGMTSRAMVT